MKRRIIKIPIPLELKQYFETEQDKLDSLRFGNIYKNEIQVALDTDDIITLLDQIDKVTRFSSYGFIQKEGFFKEFPEWLEFALKAILSSQGIDISSKDELRAIYGTLHNSNEILDYQMSRENMIKQAEYFFHKGYDGFYYSAQAGDMCRVYIDIGLGNLKPMKVCDISYQTFQKYNIEKDQESLICIKTDKFGEKDKEQTEE